VKVGNRYINLDNVAEVKNGTSEAGQLFYAVIVYNGSGECSNFTLELFDDEAVEFLTVLDKIASANWFAPVAKDELPF
jgi:hypothetical protein